MIRLNLTQVIPSMNTSYPFSVDLNDDGTITVPGSPEFKGYYSLSANGDSLVMAISDPGGTVEPVHSATIYRGTYNAQINLFVGTAQGVNAIDPAFTDITWSATRNS